MKKTAKFQKQSNLNESVYEKKLDCMSESIEKENIDVEHCPQQVQKFIKLTLVTAFSVPLWTTFLVMFPAIRMKVRCSASESLVGFVHL